MPGCLCVLGAGTKCSSTRAVIGDSSIAGRFAVISLGANRCAGRDPGISTLDAAGTVMPSVSAATGAVAATASAERKLRIRFPQHRNAVLHSYGNEFSGPRRVLRCPPSRPPSQSCCGDRLLGGRILPKAAAFTLAATPRPRAPRPRRGSSIALTPPAPPRSVATRSRPAASAPSRCGCTRTRARRSPQVRTRPAPTVRRCQVLGHLARVGVVSVEQGVARDLAPPRSSPLSCTEPRGRLLERARECRYPALAGRTCTVDSHDSPRPPPRVRVPAPQFQSHVFELCSPPREQETADVSGLQSRTAWYPDRKATCRCGPSLPKVRSSTF